MTKCSQIIFTSFPGSFFCLGVSWNCANCFLMYGVRSHLQKVTRLTPAARANALLLIALIFGLSLEVGSMLARSRFDIGSTLAGRFRFWTILVDEGFVGAVRLFA